MKRHIETMLATGLLLCAPAVAGTELAIESIEHPGRLTWSCPSLYVTCRVEWAASAGGPWHGAWADQQAIVVTDSWNEVEVPMFYRVVCEVPDPHFPDITPEQALALIIIRESDEDFAVVDVRTSFEYADPHIIGALNIDYFSPNFTNDVDALDKDGVYLIHCASGSRSQAAHNTMLELGFHEVYNMLDGMNVFQHVPGADAYIEP